MKLLLYSAMLWLAAPGTAFSQTNNDPSPIRETIFFARYGNPDWLTIKEGVQISAAELVRLHLQDLGLSEYDELRLYRTKVDDLGFTHYRYQQYHRDVKVDGGELLIHEKNGTVRTLNGKLVRGLDADVRAGVSANSAMQQALQHIPAQRYMWESPGAEALLKEVRNNPSATFYPKPELVLVAPGFTHNSADFQLAWRVEVYAEQPSVRKDVFISAQNGSVIEEVELLCSQNTPGTAETAYVGSREIITDSMGVGMYRLSETTRGNGIETLDMRRGTDHGAAVDFLDDDNHWNNINPAKDEVATDAHWGTEMVYDYFLQKHKLASIDGNNMKLISFVHFDQNWVNAQWTGDWARFGDGNGTSYGPLTSLDVVGHEFTHGLDQFSSNLRYRNESGALDESFADIFGTSIELWATPEYGDWLIGEDFSSGSPFRNMADPKKEDNPDTYKGEHWESGTADNGGVHTNSGVQNHWYYLLTVGGEGRNDNDVDYKVTGYGLDTAASIAFRNQQFYLTTLSDYSDAREGSMQAAEDIYGACSDIFKEVVNAWYAVGVGKLLYPYDLRTIAILDPAPLSCGLTGSEAVSVQFRYNGCNADLQAGDKIPMAYQIEDHPIVWDTLTLTENLTASDTLNFTFSAPPTEFATPGTYHLRCWTGLDTDLNLSNNEVSIIVESIEDQSSDVRMQRVRHPASSCLLGLEFPEVEIGFWGCDPLPEGTQIQLFYRINGGPAESEIVQTPNTLTTGERFNHTFSKPANLSAKGEYTLDVWVDYGPDLLLQNDSIFDIRIKNPVSMVRNEVLTFEAGDQSLDTVYTLRSEGSTRGEILAAAAKTGEYGYQITGGNIDKAFLFGEAQIPNNDNVWNVNPQFRSKLCICADLSGMSAADLRFDHRHYFSFYYLNKFGYNAPYASSLRVLIDDEQISPTYKPITHSFDSWKSRVFSLEDYLGKTVEICFETHTGIAPEFDPYSTNGDRIYLDNIAIVGQTNGTSDPGTAEPDWGIMPNPGTGLFTIDFPATEFGELSVNVVDALGRTVRSRHTTVNNGINLIPLNLTGQAEGIYFVELVLDNERYVRRLVIQR